MLVGLLTLVPLYLSWKLGGGLKTAVFLALLVDAPILAGFWLVTSAWAPRKNDKASLPGRPIEHYLTFHRDEDRDRYYGKKKIPIETFHEMYFAGDVDFKGDCLDVLEQRHDWANFHFTLGLIRFFLTGMVPELLMHTRSQGALRAGHLSLSLSLSG